MIYPDEFKTHHELSVFFKEVLKQYFDISELKALMHYVGIPDGTINIHQGKNDVVLDLVNYIPRHNKTIQVWNYIARNRKSLDMVLWDGSVPEPQPEHVSEVLTDVVDHATKLADLLAQITVLTAQAQAELALLRVQK